MVKATTVPSSDTLRASMKDDSKEAACPSTPGEGECPSSTPSQGVMKDEGCRKGVISSEALLERSCRRAEAGTPLWGLHVRPGAVTQFIGETSAGKTVFLHNLGRHLASGEEFLGLIPPRPLRVLHIDFESYDAIYEEHLSAVGTVAGWDFLDLEAAERVEPGPKFLEYVKAIIRDGHYDVVIFDPLMEAYPVTDENDNAHALRQMLAFRKLARGTKAGIIVVHNSGLRGKTGKSKAAADKFLGRGATMRPDKADVSINFTAPTDRERLLTVTKARSANLGDTIRVRFAGTLGYELLVESCGSSEGVIATMQTEVVRVARAETAEGREVVERKTFISRLGIEKRSAREQTLDRALGRCVKKGTLYRVSEGGYRLNAPRPAASDALQEDQVIWPH